MAVFLGTHCGVLSKNTYPFKPFFSYGIDFCVRSPLNSYVRKGAEFYSNEAERNYFVKDVSSTAQKIGFGAGVFFLVEYRQFFTRTSVDVKFSNNRSIEFLFPYYYDANNGVVGEVHRLNNINNTNIEVPIEFGYYFNYSQRVKIYLSTGLNPTLQLYSKYNFKYLPPVKKDGEYLSYDRTLIDLATTNFFQLKGLLSLGLKWRYFGAELKYYLPAVELYNPNSPLYSTIHLVELKILTNISYLKSRKHKTANE